MSQISYDAANAFTALRKFKRSNTEVAINEDGSAVMRLHGNAIARLEADGTGLVVRTAGWDTVTTKSRLNAIPGVSVNHNKGVLYLNGKPWDGGGVLLSKWNDDASE